LACVLFSVSQENIWGTNVLCVVHSGPLTADLLDGLYWYPFLMGVKFDILSLFTIFTCMYELVVFGAH